MRTFTDQAIEEEHGRQWGRFVFRLADGGTDQALGVVAEVPNRLLPARSLTAIANDELSPFSTAAAKCKGLLTNDGSPAGVLVFDSGAPQRPAPLLVSMLRLRLRRGDTVQYLPWIRFVSWVQAWSFEKDEEVTREAREELWRLEHVYDAIAIEGLGEEDADVLSRRYMTRILIQRYDNGLRTFVTTNASPEKLRAAFGDNAWSMLRSLPSVHV